MTLEPFKGEITIVLMVVQQKIEQNEIAKKTEMHSGVPEGWVIPAPLVAPSSFRIVDLWKSTTGSCLSKWSDETIRI